MKFLKALGKGVKMAGMGVKTALASTAALEVVGVLAKDNGEIPDPVVSGAKIALQLLVLYRMAQNNPDGTPSTTPYVVKKKTEGK